MAEYEIQPTVVLQKNEGAECTLESGASEFESILGSEKQFYRNKMEFSFSNSRWLTERKLAVLKI
jgi:hypothetical protein